LKKTGYKPVPLSKDRCKTTCSPDNCVCRIGFKNLESTHARITQKMNEATINIATLEVEWK
jgi:hypothetical protein